jgi:DNA polymerase III subunit delta
MPSSTQAAVRRQIEQRTPDPVYVLTGPDDREKSELAALFADLVEPELRAFNVERFYGADKGTAEAVVEAVNTLPMLGDRRLVVVMQAEKLLAVRKRGGDGDEEDGAGSLEPLIDYLGRPEPKTTLVFVLPPPEPGGDARKGHALLPLPGNIRITKTLARVATVVPCGEFSSESEVVRFIVGKAAEAGLRIEPPAATRLVELAGSDPARVRTDLERVLTFAANEGTITVDHVEEAIVAHETSSDDWAIVRAIEQRNPAAALREARMRLEAGDTTYGIIGQIGYAVRTPPPRGRFPAERLPQAIDALFRTDVALKSSGGDPRVLLERLIVELCG